MSMTCFTAYRWVRGGDIAKDPGSPPEEPQMIHNVACCITLTLFVASTASAADLAWPSFMWGEPNNAPVLKLLQQKFDEENPGNSVKAINVPIGVFWDKQFADVASGNAPDVVTLFDPDVRAYIEADLLEPLDSALASAGVATDRL